MRQFSRSDRLGEQILRDLQQLLEADMTERLPGMVTFTRVHITKDLKYATVYYSYLGNSSDRPRVEEYFLRNAWKARQKVGKGLHMRHIPELKFKFDPSIEEGIKIERLLNEIHDERHND